MSCRRSLALLLASAASAAELVQGTCDLRDAELYLKPLGIPTDLPELEVRYGHFTSGEVYLNGAETQLSLDDEELLSEAPRVKWLPKGDQFAKYSLLMLDPDWPDRSMDGISPGAAGPKLHWFVLNCKSVASTGHMLYNYESPAPKQGRHRYIFLLLEQTKPGDLNGFLGKARQGWDFKGFMRKNRDSLRPIAMNFMYVDASKTDSERMLLEDYDSEA